MTLSDKFKLQQATRAFCKLDHWNAPHAVTLTLKQGVKTYNGTYPVFIQLTREYISQNLNHFINLLNKEVYGHASQRYGKRIRVIPVIEVGFQGRLHYHLTIDCPRDDLKDSFPDLIINLWRKTFWGYNENKVDPNPDEGWITYMTKLRDKPDFADAIDWLNYYNP